MLPTLRAYTRLPIILNPNAGLPECVDGCTRFGVGPEAFSADLAGLARAGAWVVGGCCGTTPDHIAAVVQACSGITPPLCAGRRTGLLLRPDRTVRRRPGAHRRAHQPHR
ncbi:MAG: homocysteine S-methyltransferase family protein [Intestinimonas sp.]